MPQRSVFPPGNQRPHERPPGRSNRRSAARSTNTVSRQENPMKSPVVKRSIVIAGHKTSVSLEDAFWTGLKEIAAERHITLSDMVAVIDQDRRHGNLSSAIRLFVPDHYPRRRHPGRTETKSRAAAAGRAEAVLRVD